MARPPAARSPSSRRAAWAARSTSGWGSGSSRSTRSTWAERLRGLARRPGLVAEVPGLFADLDDPGIARPVVLDAQLHGPAVADVAPRNVRPVHVDGNARDDAARDVAPL